MIAEKVIRLDNIDIVNLRRCQNFARTLCTGDVRTGADLTPLSKRAAYPKLRLRRNDQRHADVKEPMRSKTESVRIKHACLKCNWLN